MCKSQKKHRPKKFIFSLMKIAREIWKVSLERLISPLNLGILNSVFVKNLLIFLNFCCNLLKTTFFLIKPVILAVFVYLIWNWRKVGRNTSEVWQKSSEPQQNDKRIFGTISNLLKEWDPFFGGYYFRLFPP